MYVYIYANVHTQPNTHSLTHSLNFSHRTDGDPARAIYINNLQKVLLALASVVDPQAFVSGSPWDITARTRLQQSFPLTQDNINTLSHHSISLFTALILPTSLTIINSKNKHTPGQTLKGVYNLVIRLQEGFTSVSDRSPSPIIRQGIE
jgi:hypothetical protein